MRFDFVCFETCGGDADILKMTTIPSTSRNRVEEVAADIAWLGSLFVTYYILSPNNDQIQVYSAQR